MNRKTEKLMLFVIVTRIAVLILPWLTTTLILPENTHPDLIDFTASAWNRWDAPHYLNIALNGYVNKGDEANFIVFFPLYPLLLKSVILFVGNPGLTAVLFSTIMFVLGCYFFYKLVSIDYPEKIARWATIALAIFPTSYFFNSPYSESLFLLLFSMSLYSARTENWSLAGIIAGLGTITRPFGFLISTAILTEWFLNKKRSVKHLPVILTPTIVAAVGYLYLNYVIYGNPFMFQKILAENWQKQIASPISGVMSSWHITLSRDLTNFVILVGWAEAITITISWLAIPFVFKYLRKSWSIFYILSLILFSSTNFILSTPRYLLSIPPFFVLLALAQKNYLFRMVWIFISVGLLFSFATIFTTGQWAF